MSNSIVDVLRKHGVKSLSSVGETITEPLEYQMTESELEKAAREQGDPLFFKAGALALLAYAESVHGYGAGTGPVTPMHLLRKWCGLPPYPNKEGGKE